MATTNNTTIRSDFDFEAYNAVMRKANAGLKLFLVTQLLGDVAGSATRYRSPIAKELVDLLDEASHLREEWKAIAAKADRQTAQGRPNAGIGDVPVADANVYQPTVY
jgi:hypothetical protein